MLESSENCENIFKMKEFVVMPLYWAHIAGFFFFRQNQKEFEGVILQ